MSFDENKDVTINEGKLTTSGANGADNQGINITDTGYSKTHKLYGDNSLHIQADSSQSILFKPNATEAARFTSNGNLLVGGTYDGFNGRQLIAFTGSGTNNVGLVIQNTATTDDKFIQFVGSSGSEVGDIIQNSATSVDYSTSSDYRKKENISLMENGLERVMKIQPSKFTWKETGKETEGFIAHQLQESGWSEGVSGYKDSESMQTIDYGKITPLLVKAIQEQQEQIETLQKEIKEINNGIN